MKNFDFKRFWNVFKCDFEYVKKSHYIPYAVITCSIVVLAIVLRVALWSMHLPWVSYAVSGVLMMAIGISVYMPSIMFAFMGNSGQRAGVLMLPATNIEKFTSRMLVYWLIPVAFSLLMFFLSPVEYAQYTIYTRTGELQNTLWYEYRLPICLIGCLSGIMILTSSIFHKKALIKTIAVLLGLIVLFVIIGFLVEPYIPKHSQVTLEGNVYVERSVPPFPFNFIQWIADDYFRISVFQISLVVIVVAVCSYIAYRRFNRFTLKS